MKKLLASVALSIVAILGVIHLTPEAVPNYQEMRQAVWRMDLSSKEAKLDQVGFCSAVAIEPDLFLTAAHCDLNADEQFMLFGPQDTKFTIAGHPYTIVKKDVDKDLMLVYVPGLNSSTVKFINFVPKQDSKVFVDGFPLGLVEFVTEGRLQDVAIIPDILVGKKVPPFLAVSAPIAGGNSGGGLFVQVHGHFYLIGICSMGGGDVALFVHPKVIAEFLK